MLFSTFNPQVALLAQRVDSLLGSVSGFSLNGWGFYPLLVAGIKRMLLHFFPSVDTISLLIVLDLFFFLLGMWILIDMLLKRQLLISSVIFSVLLFLSSPGILSSALLGRGESLVFFLVSLYLGWLDQGNFRQPLVYVVAFLLTIFLVGAVRCTDGVLLFPVLFLFLTNKLKVWAWPRKRSLPIFLGGLLLFAFAYLLLGLVWQEPLPVVENWWFFFPIFVACLLYGSGALFIGWFFSRERIWVLEGWLFVFLLFLWLSLTKSPFEYWMALPAVPFWFVSLALAVDHFLRTSKKVWRAIVVFTFLGFALALSNLTAEYWSHRTLGYLWLALDKISLFFPDVVVSKDSTPIIKYYLRDQEVVYMPKLDSLTKGRSFLMWLLDEKRQGKNVVFLSEALEGGNEKMLKSLLPKYYELDPQISFYLLDWRGCHGIIPSLRQEVIYVLERSDESSCSGLP